jgi:hypothetical protein
MQLKKAGFEPAFLLAFSWRNDDSRRLYRMVFCSHLWLSGDGIFGAIRLSFWHVVGRG